MTIRQEYSRLRANILKREKRIREQGYGSYIPEVKLEKAANLTDKQIKAALKKAQRYDKSVTAKKVSERRQKRRERYEVEKAFKANKKDAGFLKAVRKWLRRQGKPTSLINLKNLKDWQEYINYRESISNEKGKYKFDKYIEDAAEKLTEDDKLEDINDVLGDFQEFMREQQNFINEAKQAFGNQTEEYQRYYSSDMIANRYFNKGKK